MERVKEEGYFDSLSLSNYLALHAHLRLALVSTQSCGDTILHACACCSGGLRHHHSQTLVHVALRPEPRAEESAEISLIVLSLPVWYFILLN